MKPGNRASIAITVLVTLLLTHSAQAQNQLTITNAAIDTTTDPWTLTVTGQDFDGRRDPVVFLGGDALTLVAPPTSTTIRARVPQLTPGTYLLIVARGPGKNNSDSLDLVIGTRGPKGDTGPIGLTGAPGPAGTQGPVGPAGATGPTGPAGPRGFDGPTGLAGPKGDDGAIGPAGPQGPQGPAGPQGAEGKIGPQGEQGPQGEIGPAGPEGPQGVAGPQGSIGARGLQGPAGPQGPQGPQGTVGPRGPRGLQGVDGPPGPPGGNTFFAQVNDDPFSLPAVFTWKVPTGVTRVFVELWGAGGGGGGVGLPSYTGDYWLGGPGGGGGAGGYTFAIVEIDRAEYLVETGLGGRVGVTAHGTGTNGEPGGDTRFGNLVAFGGQGGFGGTGGNIHLPADFPILPGFGGDGGQATAAGSGPLEGLVLYGNPGKRAPDITTSSYQMLAGGAGGACTWVRVNAPCLNSGGDGGVAANASLGFAFVGLPGRPGMPGAIRITW